MFLLRFVRRYIRKKAYFIDQDTGVKWHNRLTKLYLFFAWNSALAVLYLYKQGKGDFALDAGLKTEAEANQPKAIKALQMTEIEKAKIVTVRGFRIVKEEDYESFDYKMRQEMEKSESTEI